MLIVSVHAGANKKEAFRMAESAKKIAKDIMKTEVVKVGPETPVKQGSCQADAGMRYFGISCCG